MRRGGRAVEHARAEGRRGTALVTGASRGIGRAIALALAGEGWEVIGTCRNPRRLSGKDRIPGVSYLPLDLAREKSVDTLLKKAGGVDLLVLNAGESPLGPAEETPLARARESFQINFFGPVRLAQGLLPAMRRNHRGMILFIGSIRSEAPTPFSGLYAAGKAAARSFAECLRMEVAGHGIAVSVLAPWYVRTTLPQELIIRAGSPYSEAMRRVKQKRDLSIRKAPDPRIVAETVLRTIARRRPAPFTVVGKPLMSFLLRHLPRSLVERASYRIVGL